MESNISNELGLRFPPIVLLKSDEKPENARGPKPGKRWLCNEFCCTDNCQKGHYIFRT